MKNKFTEYHYVFHERAAKKSKYTGWACKNTGFANQLTISKCIDDFEDDYCILDQ